MEIIPAIDIRGGKAVRFFQGDYQQETVFNDSPVAAAQGWLDMGATRLHVVDLDGAKTGEQVNIDLVGQIAALSSVPVQLGGGIRTVKAASKAVDRGVQRVIIGTAALDGTDFVRSLCEELGPERVVVGVDAKDGYVAVRGWLEKSETSALDLVKSIEDIDVQRFAYTDISRDGTLTEPNFLQAQELLSQTRLAMLVAGGVSRIAHLRRLADMGVEGAIVGTAAYTGDIDMREAIEELTPKA